MTCNRLGVSAGQEAGGGLPLPVFFVLVVGIFGDGGDWPPATFAARVVLFGLAGAFLLRRPFRTIRLNVVDGFFLVMLAVEAASLGRAKHPWISYQWFLHHFAALSLYLMVRRLPPGDHFPRSFGTLLACAGAIELLVALFQRFFQGEGRPFGTLQNPNFLAEFFVYAGASAWMGAVGAKDGIWRKTLLFLVPLFLAGIWLTLSRGGFLVALAVAALLVADRIGWRKSLLAAAVPLLAVAFVPNPLRDRFLGAQDPFAFERINMWKASARLFLEHPFGVGVGHFKYYWPVARDPVEGSIIRYAKLARTPHSEIFSLLAELGIPGVVGFAGLAAAGAVSLRRAFAAKDRVAQGAAVVLAASFLHSFVEYNYHVFGLLLVNAAALAVVSNRLFEPLWEAEISLSRASRFFGLLLLGLCAAYSAATLAGAALERKGTAAFRGGRMEEADRHFTLAARADPWRATYPDSASAVRYRLYESGKGKGYLFGALEMEQEAYRRNPIDFRYPARLGYLFSKAAFHFAEPVRGRILDSAFRFYDEAVALNPHSADLRYLKASLLAMTGRKDKARALLEAVLADEPRYVPGWVLLGELLEEVEPQRALSCYEKARAVHAAWIGKAAESYEREFLALDDNIVATRIARLRSSLKR